MSLRVTRQPIQVLRAGQGVARASRLLIQVCREDTSPPASPPPFDISDSILTQTVTLTSVILAAENLFSFDAVVGVDQEEFIVQYIGFTPRDLATCGNSIFAADEVSPLRGNHVYIAQEESADNAFGFSDYVIEVQRAENALGLTDEVGGQFIHSAENELVMGVAVDYSGSQQGGGIAQGMLRQHASFSVSGGPCPEKTYSPAIGDTSGDDYGVMEQSPPVLVRGDMVLTFPYVAPTTTLQLKNPVFGNTDTLKFKLIDRTTRGGDRVVFSDGDWPKQEVLRFRIENLRGTSLDALIAFVNESLGQKIGLTDWDGQNWSGFFVAPETSVRETVTGFNVELTFQGEVA